MSESSEVIVDYRSRRIRLTHERWTHILEHPEMQGQRDRLVDTLAAPDAIIASVKDKTIHTYHRFYDKTPVTRKYLVVVVKLLQSGGFVLTAYYTSQLKKGVVIWQK